jgi:hypothetical protein
LLESAIGTEHDGKKLNLELINRMPPWYKIAVKAKMASHSDQDTATKKTLKGISKLLHYTDRCVCADLDAVTKL